MPRANAKQAALPFTVASTSIEAFHEVEKEGVLGRLRLAVYRVLASSAEPLTGNEIDQALGGYRKAAGSQRLSELRRMGYVEAAEPRACKVTGRKCLTWRARPMPTR